MLILPAIDIKGGQCVRLLKGDFSTAERVAEDPVETALGFRAAGAEYLHMVDLDGAAAGRPVNRAIFAAVADRTGLKIEVGGGIRSLQTAEDYLSAGVSRIILGSAALSSPGLVREAVQNFGDAVAVGIDARNRMVSAEGWMADSNVDFITLAKEMEAAGVRTLIFTDISKDGTLSGPNLDQLAEISVAVSCDIVASGGITNIGDIRALTDMGLYGAICGKSLYKGTLNLGEAIRTAGASSAEKRQG